MNNTVVLFSPGPFGGAEQVILKSTKYLGAEIWLIKESRNSSPCLDFINHCIDNDIKYVVFECDSQFDFKTLKSLRKQITMNNIKLIHSHGMKANFYNSRLDVKRVATQHGKTSHTLKTKVLEIIEDFALKRMDRVVCVSESIYENYPKQNKVLVENFLSFTTTKLNYKQSGKINLVSIGRLSPEKGIAEAIRAVSNLEEVYLTIVGDGSELNSLKKLSKPLNNINFVGFQKNITKYLQDADALLMPSHREGLPMALLEATAAGLPILASNIGGIPKLVTTNGILFRPNNIKEIRHSICEFKKNRMRYNKVARLKANIIKDRYSIEKWLDKTRAIYKSLL